MLASAAHILKFSFTDTLTQQNRERKEKKGKKEKKEERRGEEGFLSVKYGGEGKPCWEGDVALCGPCIFVAGHQA